MALLALVTGANRGLGKEVARQLAQDLHQVLLTACNLKKAEKAKEELNLNALIPAQLV